MPGQYSHSDPLALNNTLAILPVDPRFPLLQPVERVRLHNDTARQPHCPESICLLLRPLRTLPLPHTRSIQHRRRIKTQVSGISQLSSHSHVPQHGIHGFSIGRSGRGFEVLNVLAETHELADEAELLLDLRPWCDGAGDGVGAQEVPRVEAREVLDYTEELVAAEGRGHVF